jgi:hypothetical protein
MSSRKENFSDFGQYAVDGLQAGENITIGDINQIINNSSSDSYNYIATIFSEYNKKVAKLDRLFRERSRSNQKNINKELQNYDKELKRRIAELQEELKEKIREKREEEEQEEENIQEDNDEDTLQSEKKSNNGGLGWKEVGMIGLVGAAIWISHKQSGGWNKEPKQDIEDIEQDIEELKKDVSELKHLIHLVNDFMKLGNIELDIDKILNDESLSHLSSDANSCIESVKDDYKTEQEQLEASYTKEYDECIIEKDAKIYKYLLKSFLDKDGYPLSSNSINKIRSLLEQFKLTEEYAQEIEEEVIRPFCIENLELYEQAYLECDSLLAESR